MYTKLAEKLAVGVGSPAVTTMFSQAVSMAGANAVQVECTVFGVAGTSPSLLVTVQICNDLENWTDGSSGAAQTAIGYHTFPQTQIAAQHVRLKYVVTGTSPVFIVGAGINTALL